LLARDERQSKAELFPGSQINRQLLVVSFPIVGNYRNSHSILSRKICLEIDKSRKFLFRGKNVGWLDYAEGSLNRTRGGGRRNARLRHLAFARHAHRLSRWAGQFDSPTSGPARTTVLSSITAGPAPSKARETTRTATGVRTKTSIIRSTHDRRRGYRLAGLRTSQAKPIDHQRRNIVFISAMEQRSS
jgi:hypothetical protein